LPYINTGTATPASGGTVCSGNPANIELKTGSTPDGEGTLEYHWTVENNSDVEGTNDTGSGKGAGSAGSQTGSYSLTTSALTNNTATTQAVNIKVTPKFTYNGATCTGEVFTTTVYVLPATPPSPTNATNIEVCSDVAIAGSFTFATTEAATYTWARSTSGVAPGTGADLPNGNVTMAPDGKSGTFTPSGAYIIPPARTEPGTVTYQIKAQYHSGCPTTNQTATTVTVTVMPTASATLTPTGATTTICSDANGPDITVALNPYAGSYSWTLAKTSSDLVITGGVLGGTDILSGTGISAHHFVNNSATTQTATYTVTPYYGTKHCGGETTTLVITVLPKTVPTLAPASTTVCTGSNPNIAINGYASVPATYEWTRDYNSTTTHSSAPFTTTSFSAGALVNATGNSIVATYTVNTTYTVNSVSCTVTPATATVTVLGSAASTLTPTGATTVCHGDTPSAINITGTANSYTWKSSKGGVANNIKIGRAHV
jgi:hypothetical protein